MTTYVGESTVRVSVVPSRVAYLVASRSKVGMLRAIQEATTRWAGVTEPIIVVTPNGNVRPWDRQLVGLSGVVSLVNVDVPETAAKRAAAAIGLPMVELHHIDEYGPGSRTSHPSTIMDRSHFGQTMNIPSDGSLWQATAIGALSEANQADFESVGVPIRRPLGDDEAGRLQLFQTTLLDYGRDQFYEIGASNGPMVTSTTLWVTSKNSFADCRMFWNLRALRSLLLESQPMILIPADGWENWWDFDRQFQSTLSRPVDVNPDVVLNSFTVKPDRLDAIAEALGLVRRTEPLRNVMRFPSPERRTPPFTYDKNFEMRHWFVFGRQYGQVSQHRFHVFQGRSVIDVPSPVEFHGQGLALLQVNSEAFDHYPLRKSVAERILPNSEWSQGSLQFGTSANARYRFEVDLPNLAEMIQVALGENRVTYTVSEKGALAHALSERVAPDYVLHPGVRSVLVELTTARLKPFQPAIDKAARRGSDVAELTKLAAEVAGRSSRRHLSVQQLCSNIPDTNVTQIEELTRLRWLERGLEVACSKCRIKSFVPFGQSTPEGSCPACGTQQGYTAEAKALKIVYRLDPIVDRASDQGVLPHLIIQARLRTTDPNAALIPGANLAFSDGTVGEADILGIHNRRILVAEVKTSAVAFTRLELDKDIRRAVATGADVLVLGCIQHISSVITDRAAAACKRNRIELLVLDGPLPAGEQL